MKSVLFAAAVLVALSLSASNVPAQDDVPPAPVADQQASPSDAVQAVQEAVQDAVHNVQEAVQDAVQGSEETNEDSRIVVDGETQESASGSGCGGCATGCSSCQSGSCQSACQTSCAPKKRCRNGFQFNMRRRGGRGCR